MMMMMRRKTSRLLMAVTLLLSSADCLLPPPSAEELGQISVQGEKYLDKQIENAILGVKEMKTVMEKSGEEHKKFLNTLEKTKQKKEEALRTAQEMESKLEKVEESCNETMQTLWEECKPCLKNTCIKYYSRTCSSGAGLVGRQLEEVLNRTSPFSIWVNGENVGVLEREEQNQNQRFHNLEEHYSEVAQGVDSMFLDSMKVFDHMRSLNPPLFHGPFRTPSLWGQKPDALEIQQRARAARSQKEPDALEIQQGARVARSQKELDALEIQQGARAARSQKEPDFLGFQSMFFPMMDVARGLFSSMDPLMMGPDDSMDMSTSDDGSVSEDVVVTKPFGNGGQMTCREIRRNSAGCIKLRDECEKCKEIQNIDCSGSKPLQGPLKQDLERALAMAERLNQEYDALLGRMEQQMVNTSSLLDFFDRQFGWVSALANSTKTKDGIFKVQTVISRDSEKDETSPPGDTKVSVQLFDTPPMTFAVPGDIPWSDPKFSVVVAQEALERYKQSSASSTVSLPAPTPAPM
ncbi:clusterin [Aplochiton taeniatus]